MQNTSTLPGIGIKPLLSLRRHYRLSIVLFFLIVLFGLPVVWIKGKSIYSAEAIFQVAPRYMKTLESDAEVELQSNSQYREFVNHLQNTVTRYDVLAEALQRLQDRGIDPKPPAKTRREYIEQLQNTLRKFAIPDTYMVRVRLEGGKDERLFLHEIVNAVMGTFLETTKAEQIFGSAERYTALQSQEKQLRDEIRAMEQERAQLAEQLGLTTFSEGVSNPYDSLLGQQREKLANANVEFRHAEATYKAFVERRELPTDLGRSLRDMRLGDMGLIGLRNETQTRVAELRSRIAGLTPKHPARAPAEAQIRQLEDTLERAETAFDDKAYTNYEARLAASVQQHQWVADSVRQSVRDMENQASRYAQIFQSAMHLTRAIQENSGRIGRIQERMNYLDTESSALGFVRLVTPAMVAEMPSGVGKTKLLLGLLIFATGAALAAPVALDMLNRRIRSVNDAERLMEIPAAGWQIHREDTATTLFAREQLRRFAATLIRNRSRSGRNVFAFTSVKSGGGTTTSLLDTAETLTTLGARVLVLEANGFSRHEGFSDFTPGVSEMLIDDLAPDALVHECVHGEARFHVIGIGDRAHQGLQRLDRLREAVAHWSRHYDYVLVDLPPILLSADAEMLIEILGQVFLIVEAEAVTKGEIGRARRLLQKIDPEAVGLIVNNVPLFRGSGYLEQSIVETVTRAPYERFTAGGVLSLQRELLRARWSLWRSRLKRRIRPVGDQP